jgi:hypothetical protein
MSSLIKNTFPHIIAIFSFLLLSVLFFRPQLSGKLIEQGDIIQYLGMAKEANDYYQKTGEVALWTNSMFGGMPTYQINTVSAGNNLKVLEQAGRLFIAEPIGQFLLAMLSFYVLMIVLGVSPIIAATGAVAFGLTTNNLILYEAGHLTKIKSISFFPLIAAGAVLTFRGKYLPGGLLFATGLGLNIFSNHLQMTYYLALTFLFLGIAQFIYDLKAGQLASFLKASLVLVAGAALALGTTASNLMTTYEYSRDTMRGKPILAADKETVTSSSQTEGLAWDYAMQWSNGAIDVLAGFIPGVAGGGSGEKVGKSSAFFQAVSGMYRNAGQAPPSELSAPLYHGDLPFTSGPIYFGAVVCFLFLLGLFTVKGPVKWWLGLGVLLTILLSMGNNLEGFNRFFFESVPFYNKFRTPNSVLSITSFLMPMLAFLALAGVLTDKAAFTANKHYFFIATGISAGLALFFALMGPSFVDFSAAGDDRYVQSGITADTLITDRKALMRSDAFRALLLVVLSAGLIWLWWKDLISKTLVVGGIALLVLFDAWSVGRRYLDENNFTDKTRYEARFKPQPADELIMKDKDPHFRVYDRLDPQSNPFASARASYFHKSVGGYHAAKLQRYQDVIDRHLSNGNMSVFNMLNTKYFIIGSTEGQPTVEPNVGACGNAWFVSNINLVESANAEIDALKTFVPEEDAFVHNEFKAYVKDLTPVKDGEITLTEYSPNQLTYTSESGSEQFAVFSEMWYGPDKGWQAYLDGKPVEHIRTNYLLRGMRVPAGKHEIKFVFEPKTFYTGKLISNISSLILLLGLIGYIGYTGYQKIGQWRSEPEPTKKASNPVTRKKR